MIKGIKLRSFNLLVLLLFMFYCFLTIPCFADKNTGSASAELEEFDFANGLFTRGMYDMSVKGYQEFLERYPDSQFAETAVFRIAECYFLSREYDKAIEKYKDFISDYPSSEFRNTADLRLAQIFLDKKQYKEAEKILLRLIGTRPDPEITSAAEYYLGLVYLDEKKYDKAKKVFTEITNKSMGTRYRSFAYLSLGNILLEEGKQDEASEAFSSAVATAGNKTLKEKIALRTAGVHLEQGKFEKAKKFYMMVINDDPEIENFDAAVIGYLSALHSNKEFEILIDQAQKFLPRVKNDDTKAQILYIIGNRYFNASDFEAASKSYSEAAGLYPDTDFGISARLNNCWALYNLKEYEDCLNNISMYLSKTDSRKDEAMFIKARVLGDTQKYEEALDVYDDLIKEFPNSSLKKEVLHQKAWILEEKGDKDNAVKTYFLFSETYPDDERSPMMLLKSAQLNYSLKNYDVSIAEYEKFLKLYPQNELRERVLYQLGNIYLEQGRNDDSIRIFEAFLKDFSGSEAQDYVRFSLGRVYQKKGDWDKAIEEFEKVIAEQDNIKDRQLYSNALESIAFCYFKKGDQLKSADKYYSLISQEHEVTLPEGVFLWVADYYLVNKNNKRSLFVLNKMVDIYPEPSAPGDLEYLFAQNYMEEGKLDEAVLYYEKAIKSGARSPYMERALLGLGQVYYRKEDYGKALDYLNQALEKHKDDRTSAFIRFEIGNVYFKKQEFEEAAKQYMMVAILYDEEELCSTALFQAGISFKSAGKDKESMDAFNELMQRYPGTPSAIKAKKYIR